MIFLYLLATIGLTAPGNLSRNPNQSSPTHEQNIQQHHLNYVLRVAVIEENDQGSEPANTATPKAPNGYISPEGALVLVGIITCIVIGVQSWYTRILAQDAKNSIFLTHRPKLIIRNVVVPWMEVLNRDTSDKVFLAAVTKTKLNEARLEGFFYVVNTGNQPATIQTLDECMFFGEALPMERPFESGSKRKNINITLQAGESRKIPFTPKPTTSMELAKVSATEPPFYTLGRVIYVDSIGNLRETGFCRRADYKTKRFVAINDPDYEYAD